MKVANKLTHIIQSQKQAGDTIVEVLLAMAVVGLVLGSSFGIANRSVRIGQSAKERTVALKIAESQIEILRQIDRSEVLNLTSPFCLVSSGNFSPGTNTTSDSSTDTCTGTDGEGGSGLYNVVIEPLGSDVGANIRTFAVEVNWLRAGAASSEDFANLDFVTLFYRMGSL